MRPANVVLERLVGASALLALGLTGGCSHPGVDRITATPRSACATSRVSVRWELTGEGTLSAQPKPAEWVDGVVESSGEREVSIGAATDFHVMVPEAPPARRDRSAHVAFLSSPEVQDRSGQASCDAAGKVRATVNLIDVEDDVRALRISLPEAERRGQRDAVPICVTHLDQRACVAPGGSHAFPVLARGEWLLELDRAADPSCTNTPGQLRIHLDFECPGPVQREGK